MRHRPFQICVSLTLCLSIGLATPLAALAETDWYTLKSHGKVIGKVGIHSYTEPGNQAGDIVTEISNVNHFTREGSPFEMNAVSRFIESPDNHQPLSFTYNYDLGEQRLLAAQGHLKDGAIDLRLTQDNTETVGQASVEQQQFLFPGGEGIKKVYRQHYTDAPGTRFSYQTLHLGVQPQVVQTEVTSLEREKLALATGESRPVRKYELSNPANREKKIYEWRDAEGKLYKSQSVGLDGMEMVYASQRQIRDVDQSTVDLVHASAVLSNIIPQPRITNDALYKILPLTGQSLSLRDWFPSGFSQQQVAPKAGEVENLDSAALYLKVQQKEPSDALATFPVEFDRQYLQATPYLQVNDPQLDQTALQVVGKESRAYYAARHLQHWVYKNIAHKDLSLGFASASQTLNSRQGDCTEHAVLLAALLRAVGIPSRVAIGLIYLPEADSRVGKFVFHMWTEAYIGKATQGDWVPLDATNPEPLPDATHIKIADSALADTGELLRLSEKVAGIMGKVRLDVIKAISPAHSVLSVEKKSGVTAVAIPKIDINRLDVQALSRQSIKHFRVTLPPSALTADSVNGLFTSGLEAQAQGKASAAGNYFRQALDKVRHPVEFYQMGERLLAVGQYGLAKQAFLQAKAKDERLAPLVANWLSAAIPENDLPIEQAALFERAIARQYQTASANGFEQSACELFQDLTRRGVGNFFPAYRAVGETCGGPEGLNALQRAVAINPDDFQSWSALGDWQMNQQQYTAASQSYRDALESIKGKPFTESRPWADELIGKMEIANGAAKLAVNKRSPQGWLHVGKGLLRQKRTDDAIQAFQNVLILQPGNAEAATRRFEIALDQSDWQYLQAHAGQLPGNSAMAAHLQAQHQMRLRHYSNALSHAQRSIALAPGYGEAYDTLAQIYSRLATQAAWQKAQQGAKPQAASPQASSNVQLYHAKAENTLKQGINRSASLKARNALALKLGLFLLARNRSPEAEPYANMVVDSDPLNGRGHWLQGKALFYAGHSEAGQQALKTALILLPNDPDVLVGLGQIAEEEGRQAQAMDYYQKAHKADESSYIATQLLRNLMGKMQVSGKKPHNFIPVTPDEHDFLVQFLRVVIELRKSSQEIKQAQLAFYGNTYGYNLAHVESIKKNIELVRKNYDTQLAYYRQIEALKTPPRFEPMKVTYLQMQRAALQNINESIALNGFHASEAQYDKAKQTMQEKSAELSKVYDQSRMALIMILNRLSNTEMSGIATEAGWDNRIAENEKALREEFSQRREMIKNRDFAEKTGQDANEVNVSNTTGSYQPNEPKAGTKQAKKAPDGLQSPSKSIATPSTP